MKTVALTGATGFVGRQILRQLIAEDCSVRVLARPGKIETLDFDCGAVEVVETDDLFAASPDRLRESLKRVDTLIHAAWYAEPGKYLTSPINVQCLSGSLRLAQSFMQVGGRRFIGVGSCAEYDLSAGFLTTDTPLNPQVLYAACKASAYHVLNQLLPAENVEFVWCRLFYLYGDHEDSRRLVPYLRRQFAAGEPAELTSGRQIRDFMDVKDAGIMIAKASLGEHQGAMNICSGIPITIKQLAEQIADEFGRRDLLKFGVRPDNRFDPPCVVGMLGTRDKGARHELID